MKQKKRNRDIKITTDANVDKFSLMLECHKETGFSNADTVTTQTIQIHTSVLKFVAKLTNFSDARETQVKKIDASEVTFMTEDANRKISRVCILLIHQIISLL